MRRPARTAATALAVATALVAASLALAAPANADSAPTDPSNPKTPVTVTADALATPQIDGVVWTQTISGNTVFAGGQFTTARPAGAAVGTSTVARGNLLSYNVTNGVLNTGFAPSANAQVKDVVASADGRYLYVAGSFTTVNGVAKNRIAKLDATTGAVVSAFSTAVNSTVSAIALSGNTLYLGGTFTSASSSGQASQSRSQLAAVDATTGAVLSAWAPKAAGGGVTALTVSPDGTKIVIGGAFTTLNGSGNPGYGLGAVNTSGTLLAWAANSIIRNGGENAGITSLTSDASGVYGTGYVFGPGGTLEGTFRSDWSGNIVWVADCHGDTYSTAVTSTAVYSAGHAHYCGTLQGFPQTTPNWTFHRAVAYSKAATLTLTAQPFGGNYTSFAGKPGPSLLAWDPELTPGTYTGKTQAAWSVAANDQYVVYGGEFPKVNGTAQQGLVRFAIASLATNKQGPLRSGASFVPNLTSTTPGRVKVSWEANADRDNATLTYSVYRDGGATPIYTTTADSRIWSMPALGFTDSGLANGSTHSYRIRATDPAGNTVLGNSASVTVASAAPAGYLGQVLGDGASSYWRLGESSGTLVHDYAGYYDQVAGAGVTRNAAGAINGGDAASSFSGAQASNGTSTSFAATQSPQAGPQTFTVEAWFKTTSTAGGKIVGFGDMSDGYSNSYDRHLYMTADGKVSFGVYNGAYQALTSPTALNNGQWHQVVGSLGSAGMRFSVDGVLVATRSTVTSAQSIPDGFWRIGGDSTWSGSRWFAGSVDDVAIYPSALSSTQVSTHYSVGKNGGGTPPVANGAPTASFSSTTSGLGVSVNGSGSSDPDGSIASYSWAFGDGGTATGATATHTYAAAGTYTVQLTVKDDDGASASTTRSVSVTGGTTPPATGTLASDTFQRTVTNGWGTADTGGVWTLAGGAANFGVSPGTGSLTLTGPSAQASGTLASVAQTSSDLTAAFSLSTVATGGGTSVSFRGRKVGSADYRATVLLKNNGTAAISLLATGTTIAPAVVIPGTIAAGTSISVRVQVTGTGTTTVRAKAWLSSGPEPSAWTVSATDTTAALQAAGSVGVLAYESGSATNGAQTLRVTSFTVVTP